MSLVISIAEFLQLLYEYVPKELVIIIMASLTMFIFLEHADRKREREWQEEYTKNKPKSVRSKRSRKD